MNSSAQDSQLFAELAAAQKEGNPVVLAVVTKARGSVPRRAGAKMLIYADGRTSGTIGGGEMEGRVLEEATVALDDGLPRVLPYSLVDPGRGDPGVCGGEVEIYLEPYRSADTVLVIGCGHVGRSVAHLASWLGFRVAVSDDRVEMASPEVTPGADLYLPGPIDEVLKSFDITTTTYIVTVTRNVLVDRQILPLLLDSPSPYIGVIGSQRRWEETKKLLREDGLTDEQLERCHSPIGLELHAETPEEIAVSIMAEVILKHRGGAAQLVADETEAMQASG